ncbi:MAG: YqgE/AlgH family protein [Pirellulaceae bacterium]|nr:YqgE/AlgH family protein [Pirellulaceae bacterium]
MSNTFVEGQALVASPFLADRNFLRSVVYIVKHDDEGAYGLILNRPTNLSVGALLEQILEEKVENNEPIYHGGPVEGPIVLVHEQASSEETAYVPGVYLSSNQDELAKVCSQSANRYRVFNGYAGWAPQQLEEELKQGGWLVWKLTKDDIFSPPDEIWQTALRQIGREILTESIPTGRIPVDPNAN